jgi:hypothetical protein
LENALKRPEPPFDREALIAAYRAMHRTHDAAAEVDRLTLSEPEHALAIAVEIIHRGMARGWDSFDVMSPLQSVLVRNSEKAVARVEELAKESVGVRRVLWWLRPQLEPWVGSDGGDVQEGDFVIDADVWERLQRASGTTTDDTDLELPVPPAQRQPDADERLIEGWFENQENFWAFSELSDYCTEDPALAWSITLDLLDHAEDEEEVCVIAAGPLEDLIRKQPDVVWADMTAKAHSDPRFADALRGVWVFESDGEVYTRFRELMESLDS